MNLSRLFVSMCFLMATVSVCATEADGIRKKLEHAQGAEKLELLSRLCDLSLEEGDYQLQWRCINDYLKESRKQNNNEETSYALWKRLILFYNNDQNDSVIHYAPDDIIFIRDHGKREKFYDTWSCLVNTYVYCGSLATGLKEAEKMYQFAKEDKDDFGSGLACYVMGNAYNNMNNLDEAAAINRQGIEILMRQKPIPLVLSELFSSQCEVLEKQQRYQEMQKMNAQWLEFLEQFIKENQLTRDYPGMLPDWAYYYIGCAEAALGLGDIEQADKMLEEARKDIPDEESSVYRAWLFYRIRYLTRLEFYPEALLQSDQLLTLHEGVGDMAELIRVKQQRAEILTHMGRHADAAKLYNEMYLINDSINTSDTKRQLAEMNTKYALDEERMKRAEEQMRSIITIATIIVLSLAVFLYFRIRSSRRLKKAHESLAQAHGKLEETHQQLLTAYDQLEETTTAKERMESELRIAREIQMGMVPSLFPQHDHIDIYGILKPAKEVGGDLYDFFIQNNRLYFCIGDVSGKGIPASLFMSVIVNLFRMVAKEGFPPEYIATRLNETVSENNENGMFCTMFIGEIDMQSGKLLYCNAGHNPPVMMAGKQSGETSSKPVFVEMESNAPIGLWPELVFKGEEIENVKGWPLFLYTDGLSEAEDGEQLQFGDDRVLDVIASQPFEGARQLVERLSDSVKQHVGNAPQSDDLTMLCIMCS